MHMSAIVADIKHFQGFAIRDFHSLIMAAG